MYYPSFKVEHYKYVHTGCPRVPSPLSWRVLSHMLFLQGLGKTGRMIYLNWPRKNCWHCWETFSRVPLQCSWRKVCVFWVCLLKQDMCSAKVDSQLSACCSYSIKKRSLCSIIQAQPQQKGPIHMLEQCSLICMCIKETMRVHFGFPEQLHTEHAQHAQCSLQQWSGFIL